MCVSGLGRQALALEVNSSSLYSRLLNTRDLRAYTTTTPSVYITRRIPQPGIDTLTRAGFTIDTYDSDDAIPNGVLVDAMQAKPYDALLCMLTDQIDATVLDAAGPQLKIVSTMSVGYEKINREECQKRKIYVANTPDVSTDSVAELTVTLLLDAAKRTHEGVAAVSNGKWGKWKPMWLLGTELRHKVLGIYGFGSIGRNVGRLLKPWEFSNIYYNDMNAISNDIGAKRIEKFDDFIKECDFIVCVANCTPQNKHIFNKDTFRQMKNDCIIVNVGRGGIIDHDDLHDALVAGEIKAAGLDVTEPEPLPREHPLVALDSCVITPHMGSNTWEARNKMAVLAAQNVIAGVSGGTPEGIVPFVIHLD